MNGASVFLQFLAIIEVGSSDSYRTVDALVHPNKVLAGSQLRILKDIDWLRCIEVCANDRSCTSYNFKKSQGLCELNCASISECDVSGKALVNQEGYIFHQLHTTKGTTDNRCKRQATDVEDGGFSKPIALYPLTQSIKSEDRSNFHNSNAVIGQPIDYVNGPYQNVGGSTKFHGEAGSFVEIPNNRGSLDTKNSITIATWVYPLSGGSIISYYDKSHVEHTQRWGVRICAATKKTLTFKLVSRDYKINKQLDFPMNENQWNYVAATYDHASGVAVLWANNEKKEEPVGHFKLATNHAVLLGSAENYHFSGRIFCLQIFKKALDKMQLHKARDTCTKFHS